MNINLTLVAQMLSFVVFVWFTMKYVWTPIMAALETRKQHKPKNSALQWAADMGAEILTTEEYRRLQKLGEFDTKTSSWLKTPPDIRALGGAIFGDYRYGTVFVYHNGAESYYAARGFRCSLRV